MRSLHLAGEADIEKLLPLVAAFHAEMGIDSSEDHRLNAIAPLLAGLPQGAIWLVGPRRAPVGYIAVSFGWSIEFGGMDAIIDELYIRPAVRKRGMGHEAVQSLAKALSEGGVRALHLEVDTTDETTQRFYARARFQIRDRYSLMTRML